MSANRLILIEFNELCPTLLERWMRDGFLPNFSAFYSKSEVFVTQADELEAPNLEPWIQWYSLHTGLPFSVHGVFHLTDGPEADHADLWSTLHSHGYSVCNFSSMNARQVSGNDAVYLPDPWCSNQKAVPDELNKFYRTVSRQVKEYSNSDHRGAVSDNASFLSFLLTHGLSIGTVYAIVRQLFSELLDPKQRWRRPVLLDKLQFDVFRHYFRARSPSFSTFFVNSTAHFQHTYWRYMEPTAFKLDTTDDALERHKDSILFGYREMDHVLGRFIELAGKDTVLIFATALSQQPYTKYDSIGGQHFYRPRAIEKLLARLNLHPVRIDPVMTHQFVARFQSEADAQTARDCLAKVSSPAGPVFNFDPAEPGSVYFGCQIRTAVPQDLTLDMGLGSKDQFSDWFYQIEGLKSGRHHPDGCLWIRRGIHKVAPSKVSILDAFPTVLDFFGISASGYEGHSLIRA